VVRRKGIGLGLTTLAVAAAATSWWLHGSTSENPIGTANRTSASISGAPLSLEDVINTGKTSGDESGRTAVSQLDAAVFSESSAKELFRTMKSLVDAGCPLSAKDLAERCRRQFSSNESLRLKLDRVVAALEKREQPRRLDWCPDCDVVPDHSDDEDSRPDR